MLMRWVMSAGDGGTRTKVDERERMIDAALAEAHSQGYAAGVAAERDRAATIATAEGARRHRRAEACTCAQARMIQGEAAIAAWAIEDAIRTPTVEKAARHDVQWHGVFRGTDEDPRETGWCEMCGREVYDGDSDRHRQEAAPQPSAPACWRCHGSPEYHTCGKQPEEP